MTVVNRLVADLNLAQAQIAQNHVDIADQHLKSQFKIKEPDTFSGERKELADFLSQLDTYIHLTLKGTNVTEGTKVRMAGTYLKGDAAKWMRLITRDHDDNLAVRQDDGTFEDERDENTKKIMRSYKEFKKALEKQFGDIDEKREAEQALFGLKQLKSASAYTTKFQQHAAILGWDDEPLINMYYRGLKDNVKDELSRDEWPDDIQDFYAKTIRIDNRIWQRAQEKRGYQAPRISNHGAKRQPAKPAYHSSTNDQGYLMDLSKMERKKLSEKEKKRRYDEGLCVYCGSPDHKLKDCTSKKKNFKQSRSMGRGGYNEQGYHPDIPTRELRPMSRVIHNPTHAIMELYGPGQPEYLIQCHGPDVCQNHNEQYSLPPDIAEDDIELHCQWRLESKATYTIPWERCYNDFCKTHYHKKLNRNKFPRLPSGTSLETLCWTELEDGRRGIPWYFCYLDQCTEHKHDQPTPADITETLCEDTSLYDIREWYLCHKTSCRKHWAIKVGRGMYPFEQEQDPSTVLQMKPGNLELVLATRCHELSQQQQPLPVNQEDAAYLEKIYQNEGESSDEDLSDWTDLDEYEKISPKTTLEPKEPPAKKRKLEEDSKN